MKKSLLALLLGLSLTQVQFIFADGEECNDDETRVESPKLDAEGEDDGASDDCSSNDEN